MNVGATSLLLLLLTAGCRAKLPYIIKYNCDTNAPIRPEWLPDIIPENYTHLLPPNPDGCPTYVRVDIVPFTIGRVSIPDMTFDMDLYVGLLWEDYQLNIPNNFTFEIGIDAETAESIWTPTVRFRNSHSSSGMIKFNPATDKLKLKGKQLFYYVRKFAKFHCNFDISLYPMDQQLCFIEIQSVGEEKDTVILLDHVHYYDLLSDSKPTEFTLSAFSSGTCQRPDFTAPALTCIEYRFILNRRCGDHYLLSYMPSVLVIILSWLSFWIDASSITPRLAIGLTAILTMIAHFSIELKEIPPVSYVKAIDIWIFGCLFIVFLSVVEASLAHAMVKRKKKRMASSRTIQRIQQQLSNYNGPPGGTVPPRNWDAQWGVRRREVRPYITTAEEFNASSESLAGRMKDQPSIRNAGPPSPQDLPAIETPSVVQNERPNNFSPPPEDFQVEVSDNVIDKVSRILFPLMFIVFNISYWSYFQSKEITLPKEVD